MKKRYFEIVLRIINEITFENRKFKKGILAHLVVDSGDYRLDLNNKLVDFDDTYL